MTMTQLQDHYLHLYADCIPVSGACKTAIYDLTRQEIVRFPSVYLHILQQAQQDTVSTILAQAADEESRQSIIAFFRFLLENEFVNLVATPGQFPTINAVWDKPCLIQNAIIDINTTPHDYAKLFQQLDALGCEIVEIRCFSHLHTLHDLQDILRLAYHTSIQGVELLLKYDPRCSDTAYLELVENEPIIARCIVHSAPRCKELLTTFGCGNATDASLSKQVVFVEAVLTSHQHCGVIQLSNMSPPTANMVFENTLYNGCLNRKIAIDTAGYIKNCPSMAHSFGHHKDTSLIDVALQQTFQKVWSLRKDNIKQCQDCEFRYVCTDCRAYLEDPQDMLSKPLKCGYDPYRGVWESWHCSPQKAWAIRHYEALSRTTMPAGRVTALDMQHTAQLV